MARTPFETLQKLRRQAVDEAARSLGQRRAETDVARGDLQRAQRDVEQERSARSEAAEHEADRAEQGQVQVADLQRLSGFEHASRSKEQALAERGQRARQALEQALVRDERAEQELGQARSESRAVDLVQERIVREKERVRELQREEEASEAWQASKG